MRTKEFKVFLKQYLTAKTELKPLFIEGPPGIGKTEIIEQLAKELNYESVVTHLGSKTIEHFSGLPEFKKRENGSLTTQWSEAAVVDLCNTGKPTILFLDDVHLASEVVIKILFEALTDRSIHGVPLNPDVRIIAAMNQISSEMGSTIAEIPEPVRNRYVRLQVKPDIVDWLHYANNAGVHPIITSFLSVSKEYFYKPPEDDIAQYPTPRSWVGLSQFLNAGFTATDDLVEGCVGKAAATELITFYNVFLKFEKEKPSSWASLNGYREKIAFIAYLARVLDVKLAIKYADDITKDSEITGFALELIQKIVRKVIEDKDNSKEAKQFKDIVTEKMSFRKINFLDV